MSQPYIDFAFVKEHASFERVLAHYDIAARGTGVQRSVLCPFHTDKRPSCRIELGRKIFHCFACGVSGNILEFVARLEGNADDLRAAAVKIAGICGIGTAAPRETPAKPRSTRQKSKDATPPRPKAEPKAPAPPPPPPASAAEPVNAPLTFALKLDPEHPYLAERGLSAEIIAEFGLGYCNRGIMAGRICIPIHDANGELVAYAGRWPGEPPEDTERYRLPARFEKSRVLFNLNRIGNAEHVVLVEGYWSTFRLHALGVPVAALMGSSVSEEQLGLLRVRGTRRLTVLWDGDDAGGAARERWLPALASAFFTYAPVLPSGEKPDTLPERALRALVGLD